MTENKGWERVRNIGWLALGIGTLLVGAEVIGG